MYPAVPFGRMGSTARYQSPPLRSVTAAPRSSTWGAPWGLIFDKVAMTGAEELGCARAATLGTTTVPISVCRSQGRAAGGAAPEEVGVAGAPLSAPPDEPGIAKYKRALVPATRTRASAPDRRFVSRRTNGDIPIR